jgi:hypothetical protein
MHPPGLPNPKAKPAHLTEPSSTFLLVNMIAKILDLMTKTLVSSRNSDLALRSYKLWTKRGFRGAGSLHLTGDSRYKLCARSKREQERLHRFDRPVRKAPVDDDLPSVNSHTDDEEVWSSDIGGDSSGVDSGLSEDAASEEDESLESDGHRTRAKRAGTDSDAEMFYEAAPRRRRPSWSEGESVIDRLPIKLLDGQIQRTGHRPVVKAQSLEESEEENTPQSVLEPESPRDDITTGARFGRLSVIDVISNRSKKLRIQLAREQIASICQEIVADPENSVSPPPIYILLIATYATCSLVSYGGFTPSLCTRCQARSIPHPSPMTPISASWRYCRSLLFLRTSSPDTASVS